MKALILSLAGCWLALALSVGHTQTKVITTIEPEFSQAELDQMLAPIALYPDTVLSHILIASTYPLEVVQADRWAQANRGLEAEDAVNAVEFEDWDPSVKALVAFPDILRRMSDDLDWTQRLGDAFLADETLVMDTIQSLRSKAYASGNLRDTKYIKVQREKKIIVIEPAVERVVYIPYYDTRVVYGNWWWDRYPPVYWHHPVNYVHIGGFYWGPRTYLSTSFFFSSPHWHQRRIVVIDYHRHDHHHPRFYSGRKIARYDGAHHWQHNPRHRHNVSYRSERVRHKYHHDHDGGRFVRDSRERDNRHSSWRGQDDKARFDQKHRGDRERVDGKRHSDQRDRHRDNDQWRNRGENRDDRRESKLVGKNREGDRVREQDKRQVTSGDNRVNAGENRDRSRYEGVPSRAEQIRERLAQDQQRETKPRENQPQQWRERDKQDWRSGDKQRERDGNERKTSFRSESKQPEQRTDNRRTDLGERREHLQRVQQQNGQANWRSERKEQTQQQRQDVPRQEQRNLPQPRNERQTDNRRHEQPRSQPSPRADDRPRREPGQERETRRFER